MRRSKLIPLIFAALAATHASADTLLNVYKSESCGCCGSWIEHVQKAGFTANAINTPALKQLKADHGIHPKATSCHTAVSEDGYVFEGHVPAKLVKMFLDNPPEGAIGLSVPGMPAGSPGMEMGDKFQPYTVVMLLEGGDAKPWVTVSRQDLQY